MILGSEIVVNQLTHIVFQSCEGYTRDMGKATGENAGVRRRLKYSI